MYQNWGYGYQYPVFRGVQNVPQPVNIPQPNVNLQTPPDTVSFKATEHIQTKPKKEGLSTGAKWGLGALALAGVGTAIYFATRGRVGAKQAQQLVEHIEFKPAKTAEEAKKFAQEKFGVQYHDINDVDVINGLNEWITGVHNTTKTINKGAYPKYIANNPKLEEGVLACLYDDTLKVAKNTEGYVMGINMSMFKDFDKSIASSSRDARSITKSSSGKYQIVDEAYNTEFVRNLLERIIKYNPKTATFKEKSRIMMDIKGLIDGELVNGKIKEAKWSDFYYFNHELGHLRHQESTTNFKLMKKIKEYVALGEKPSDISKEFVSSKNIQTTARKVSEYATESPAEFVTETFAGLLEDRSYSIDLNDNFNKKRGQAFS